MSLAMIVLVVLAGALTISHLLTSLKPSRSDAEEIAAAHRELVEHDRELARLRELAARDLPSAMALHRLLTDDLIKTREAWVEFKKNRSDHLIRQFTEDEKALVSELRSLEVSTALLRLRSGAA